MPSRAPVKSVRPSPRDKDRERQPENRERELDIEISKSCSTNPCSSWQERETDGRTVASSHLPISSMSHGFFQTPKLKSDRSLPLYFKRVGWKFRDRPLLATHWKCTGLCSQPANS